MQAPSNEVLIDVAVEFSATPGGRYKSEGVFSGEEFREKFLEPHIKEGKNLAIDLDGPEGFTSSFLEEAFGGLVRVFGKGVVARLRFVADAKPHRARKAAAYVQRAVDAS
jgi:hypothetical protein